MRAARASTKAAAAGRRDRTTMNDAAPVRGASGLGLPATPKTRPAALYREMGPLLRWRRDQAELDRCKPWFSPIFRIRGERKRLLYSALASPTLSALRGPLPVVQWIERVPPKR